MWGGRAGIPHSKPEPGRRLSRACVISSRLHKAPRRLGWGAVCRGRGRNGACEGLAHSPGEIGTGEPRL